MRGLFLEKPGLLKEALRREEEWVNSVPGYDYTMNRFKRPMTSRERSLYKLEAERELERWADETTEGEEGREDEDVGNTAEEDEQEEVGRIEGGGRVRSRHCALSSVDGRGRWRPVRRRRYVVVFFVVV